MLRKSSPDIWRVIALFCDLESLFVLLRVSNVLHTNVNNEIVWNDRLRRHYPEEWNNFNASKESKPLAAPDVPKSKASNVEEKKFTPRACPSYKLIKQERLLEAKRRQDKKQAHREVKLLSAFAEGNFSKVQELKLSIREVPYLYNRHGCHAVFLARENGHQYVLDKCYAQIIFPFFNRKTLLGETVEYDFTLKDSNGWDLLSHAVLFNQPIKTIDALLTRLDAKLKKPIYAADTSLSLNYKLPAQHIAAWTSNVPLTNYLLMYSVTHPKSQCVFMPNLKGRDARMTWPIDSVDIWKDTVVPIDPTPLHMAAQQGCTPIVKILFKFDLGPMVHKSFSPFYLAVQNNHVEAVAIFLANGANPNAGIGPLGMLPLFLAAEKGYVNLVRLLASQPTADVNRMNGYGTPLFIALNNGHRDVVRVLIEEFKAALHPITVNDHSVLHFLSAYRSQCGMEEVEWLVHVARELVHVTSKNNEPLLHIHYLYPDIQQLLLNNGADPNVNFNGRNIFDIVFGEVNRCLIIKAQLKDYIQKLESKNKSAGEFKSDFRMFLPVGDASRLAVAKTILSCLEKEEPVQAVITQANSVLKKDAILRVLYERACSIRYGRLKEYRPRRMLCSG